MIDLQNIRHDLTTLAKSSGWVRTERFCSRVAVGKYKATLFAGKGIAANEFRDKVFPDGGLYHLEDLDTEPETAFSSALLVAVFSCGQLLSADEVAKIQAFFHTRPKGSYLFVFLNPATPSSSDSAEGWRRGAWRLLVCDPKADYAGQSLADAGIFAWNGESPDQSEGRVVRETDLLPAASSLAPTEDNHNAILRAALLYAISIARNEASTEVLSTNDDDREIAKTRESLRSLRRRIADRLAADSSQLEEQTVVAIRGLQADLAAGLTRALEGEHPGLWTVYQPNVLRQRLHMYLSQAIDSWSRITDQRMRNRCREIESETRTLLGSVNWTCANNLPGGTRYPDAIVQLIEDEPPYTANTHDAQVEDALGKRWPRSNNSADILSYLGSGGLLVGIASFGHLLVSCIGAAVLTPFFWHKYQRKHFKDAADTGHAAIGALVEKLTDPLSLASSSRVRAIRQLITEQFDIIVRQLDLHEVSRNPVVETDPDKSSAHQLDRMERTLARNA